MTNKQSTNKDLGPSLTFSIAPNGRIDLQLDFGDNFKRDGELLADLMNVLYSGNLLPLNMQLLANHLSKDQKTAEFAKTCLERFRKVFLGQKPSVHPLEVFEPQMETP